jgi:ParB family chromosome partitioning protein
MTTAARPRIDMSGLAPLLNLDELEQDTPVVEEPPRMALDLIDEDPDQPRTEFDPVALQELADNIAASGGVKSPVSLRPHPLAPGRYMLNFGARRLRASRLAGLPDIPYFIDRQVDSFDQVAENEQREPLTAMELSLFIKARVAEGMTLTEIAERLGKSKSFISRAAVLAEAPECVQAAYRDGRLRGSTEAYELAKLHAQTPAEVEQWTANVQEITRTTLTTLKERLASLTAPAVALTVEAKTPAAAPANQLEKPNASAKLAKVATAPAPRSAPARPVLMAEYKGQPLALDVADVPAAPGHVYGRRLGSSRRLTVPAAHLKLTGFA